MTPSPYTQPPTRIEMFCLQGGVMVALERWYAVWERIQRAVNLARLDRGIPPEELESFEAFFNRLVVNGLVNWNPKLVELAGHLPGTACPPPKEADAVTLCRVMVEDLRRTAEGLAALHPASANREITQAVGHLVLAAAKLSLYCEEVAAQNRSELPPVDLPPATHCGPEPTATG